MSDTAPTSQDRILTFICAYAADHAGVSPTVRTIAAGVGLKKSTVAEHLRTLETAGSVEWVGSRLMVVGATWIPPQDTE
jgi:SOS-response transcriptional repressor LexA